jgi:hypothetical protein
MVSTIIAAILDWLAGFFAKWLKQRQADQERRDEIERDAKDKIDHVKNSETEKEREDATTDLAGNSF